MSLENLASLKSCCVTAVVFLGKRSLAPTFHMWNYPYGIYVKQFSFYTVETIFL